MIRARVLRVWDVLRTQQLEFLPDLTPGILLYRVEKYDFDASMVDPDTVRRCSPFRTAAAVLTGSYEFFEPNEPTMVHLWRFQVAHAVAFRLNRLWRRAARIAGSGDPVPLWVLYAIDNFEARRGFQARGTGPAWLRGIVFDLTFRFLLSGVDRIAFGTQGAKDVYTRLGGRAMRGIETTVIAELDQPCGCGPVFKDEHLLLFVGALDDRKGVLHLMAAWPRIRERNPDVRLVIVGKGQYAEPVAAWAEENPEVSFVNDPPRAEIHAWYRRARAVVLLSQPHPRWREQVGLPITEGLSHGCAILATSQTGVAQWLSDQGHVVVAPEVTADELAEAVAKVFAGPSEPAVILASLPGQSTRITVDAWLMRSRPQV